MSLQTLALPHHNRQHQVRKMPHLNECMAVQGLGFRVQGRSARGLRAEGL